MAETAAEQAEREQLNKLLRFLEQDSIAFGGDHARVISSSSGSESGSAPLSTSSSQVKTLFVDRTWKPTMRGAPDRHSLLMPISEVRRSRISGRGVKGGNPITLNTAMELRSVVYGSCHHSFSREWQKSNLALQHGEGNFPYGLVAHRCGSRGLTLCVQGFLLRFLLFGHREYQSSFIVDNVLEPNSYERRRAMISALSEILWQAGDRRRSCICLLQDQDCFDPNYKYRPDKITERLHLFEFRKLDDLKAFVKRHLEHFQGDHGCGCILFLYSVVLSRSISKIREDLCIGEDSKVKLLTDMEECSQPLINLLLTGRAVPGIQNGEVIYNSHGDLLSNPKQGSMKRSDVGFLFWDRAEADDNRTEVGSMLKTPRYPIWLTKVNGHFGLLFSTNIDLVSDWRAEHRFTLIYYTGLVSQEKTTYLSVDTRVHRAQAKTSFMKKKEDEKLPALEHCIMSKWFGANVSWNGVFPYY